MRATVLALGLFFVGCGDVDSGPAAPAQNVPTIITGAVLDCRLDADLVACRCDMPEWNAEMLRQMSQRCTDLRAYASGLY